MEFSEENLLFTIKVAKCWKHIPTIQVWNPAVAPHGTSISSSDLYHQRDDEAWTRRYFPFAFTPEHGQPKCSPSPKQRADLHPVSFHSCALYRIQTWSFWIVVHYCRSKSQLLLKRTIKFPLTPAGQSPAMLLYCFLIFNCKTRTTTPNSGIFLANVLGFYRISWAKHQHLCWSWDLFYSLQEIICIQLQNLCQERKNSALMETKHLINVWRIQKHKNLCEEGPQSSIDFCLPYFSLYNKDAWEKFSSCSNTMQEKLQ